MTLIYNWLKKKAEEKYKKGKRFYDKFEYNMPTLEFWLMRKYPNKKWLSFLIIHIIDISFIIFWIWSLYYVSSVDTFCQEKIRVFNLIVNGGCYQNQNCVLNNTFNITDLTNLSYVK